MKYYNGFQTIIIEPHFVSSLQMYDKDLLVWQNDIDQYFYISYNPYRSYQCSYEQEDTARKRVALKVENELGERCLPSERDIYKLMSRDGKFTTAKEMIKGFDSAKEKKDKATKQQTKKNVQEGLRSALRKYM